MGDVVDSVVWEMFWMCVQVIDEVIGGENEAVFVEEDAGAAVLGAMV